MTTSYLDFYVWLSTYMYVVGYVLVLSFIVHFACFCHDRSSLSIPHTFIFHIHVFMIIFLSYNLKYIFLISLR